MLKCTLVTMISPKQFKCLLILLLLALVEADVTILEAGIVPQCGADDTGTIWKCNHIPLQVPETFSSVEVLVEFDIHCDNTSFQSLSWQTVEILKLINIDWEISKFVNLDDYCFKNLKNLRNLSIDIGFSIDLSPKAFAEANSVTFLSLAKCERLEWKALLDVLNGSDKVPNLTALDLTDVHTVYGPVSIDEKFADVLATRNLTSLNLSQLQVSFLNLTSLAQSLKYLSKVNISWMNINDAEFKAPIDDIKHIDELDMSNTILPKNVLSAGPIVLVNTRVKYNPHIHKVTAFLYVRTIIIDGTFKIATIKLFNCELIVNAFIQIKTETISARNNNLKYLNVHVSGDAKYRNTTVKHIDFSQNTMEFLNPAILSLAPNLETLILAENSLYKMLIKDEELFETLFYSNTKLIQLDMSVNSLFRIPTHQFIYNEELEEINLANNVIEQVDWKLGNLTKLKLLDLRYNKISTLDSTSLNNLNSLESRRHKWEKFMVRIRGNPISCATCNDKPFIEWLTKTRMVNLSADILTCSKDNGVVVNINTDQIQRLQWLCDVPIILIASITSAAFAMTSVVLLTYAFLRRRKIRQRNMKRDQLLANIQRGEGEFEFVTMLSYNNQEEEFIRQYVLEPLNDTLQTLTGADRELVLTGDQHFRPGFMVHSEIATCLERVCLVIMLITNEFCTSGFCLSELDQAWIQRKPMIFMFKDEVDVNLMTPIMKTIYKKNVRILWTLEDGEYILKTTWENVCEAIMELIIQ